MLWFQCYFIVKINIVCSIDCVLHSMPLLWNKVETGKSEWSSGEVISLDVFIIGCGDVKWMIML